MRRSRGDLSAAVGNPRYCKLTQHQTLLSQNTPSASFPHPHGLRNTRCTVPEQPPQPLTPGYRSTCRTRFPHQRFHLDVLAKKTDDRILQTSTILPRRMIESVCNAQCCTAVSSPTSPGGTIDDRKQGRCRDRRDTR